MCGRGYCRENKKYTNTFYAPCRSLRTCKEAFSLTKQVENPQSNWSDEARPTKLLAHNDHFSFVMPNARAYESDLPRLDVHFMRPDSAASHWLGW
jgi:hypothetical protein